VSLFSRLMGTRKAPRTDMRPLWHRLVEIAREEHWYAREGVADTVSGRFDAVTLVMALAMLRMERAALDTEAPAPLINASAHLTELFVEDMDGQLRQSGVGDLVVGKRMGKLVSVLGGRIGALRDALAPHSDTALEDVLARNVTLNEGASTAALAEAVRALHTTFQSLSDDDLLAARIAR